MRRCGLSAWTRLRLTAAGSSSTSWGCHVQGSDLVADRHRQHHRAGDHHDRQRANVSDSVTWSTLATGIQFEWTPRVFGGNQDLYRSKDVIEVPPGNKTVEARYSYPSAYVGFFVNATPPTIIATTSGGRKLTNVGFRSAAIRPPRRPSIRERRQRDGIHRAVRDQRPRHHGAEHAPRDIHCQRDCT